MTDILLTNNNELEIVDGDFNIGFSDDQHKRLLLQTAQGEWKIRPDVGVGPYRFLEGENPEALLRETRQQFTADGMEVKNLTYENGQLKIDAAYRTI